MEDEKKNDNLNGKLDLNDGVGRKIKISMRSPVVTNSEALRFVCS